MTESTIASMEIYTSASVRMEPLWPSAHIMLIENSDYVRIYENISGTWTQIGDDIDGEETDDDSGESVSLSADGTIVAIGACYNNGNGEESGHVRVYENVSGTWTQIGDDIDGEAAKRYSGRSVSLSGDGAIVAIDTRGNVFDDGHDPYAQEGYIRVFESKLLVTYDGNTNKTGTVPIDHNTYYASSIVTVLGNLGNLQKNCHIFDGWNTSTDGSGTPYNSGDTFILGNSDMILYAQWEPYSPCIPNFPWNIFMSVILTADRDSKK